MSIFDRILNCNMKIVQTTSIANVSGKTNQDWILGLIDPHCHATPAITRDSLTIHAVEGEGRLYLSR